MRDARQIPRRVLILRLGSMGDVLHALPAVHLLREAVPKCEIGWAIEHRWRSLLCAPTYPGSGEIAPERPLVNTIHDVDTRRWRRNWCSRSTWREVSSALAEIRADKYEVAVDFQGAMKSSLFGTLAGAGSLVGFQNPREAAARLFYSHTVDARLPHVVDQNFALIREVAGDAVVPPKTLLPVDTAAEEWVTKEFERQSSGKREIGRFAILAPTAGWAAKEWPVENYGTVARELASQGVVSLVSFGPGEEAVAQKVVEASGGAAIAFPCTLSQLIALTRRATLFIGGDTGPMHLAAALQVPVVALFGPTDPARNGPYSPRAKVLRSPQSATSYSHVSTRDAGLASITPRQVLDAVASLLG